jgi:hypothetical protein
VRGPGPPRSIPHELRRDLRGAYALFAWLDLGDVKEANTLDAWVADPGDPGRHYVKHYLIDFGKGLGATALFAGDPRRGREYVLDVPGMLTSLATFGLGPRLWERRAAPALRGVGLLDAETYDPGAWKPYTPAYLPFRTADAYDKLWAAKIIMRFTREQLRAAASAARYSDPRATDYVVETLIARQRATARHWSWRVSPLDRFELAQGRLCFDDLMLVHRLALVVGATRYTVTATDPQGRRVGAPLVRIPDDIGRSCVGPIPLSRDADAYTVLRIDTARLDFRGTTYVHVARGRGPEGNAPRVIGVWRP